MQRSAQEKEDHFMTFNREEAPVAHSMVALIRQLPENEYKPFQEFMCYWIAFNNIYTKIADNAGLKPRLMLRPNGKPKTYQKADMQIPKVRHITEKEQMKCAFGNFSEDLKHQLITHPNTEFFVRRIPKLYASRIETDASGQHLNGVINVGFTVNSNHPVWSPIDKNLYEHYLLNNQDSSAKNDLAKQILCMLYTIRNNIFHGGKRGDDADDLNIVEKAVPLLSMIVSHFLD